jgi:hypothetical protein
VSGQSPAPSHGGTAREGKFPRARRPEKKERIAGEALALKRVIPVERRERVIAIWLGSTGNRRNPMSMEGGSLRAVADRQPPERRRAEPDQRDVSSVQGCRPPHPRR